MGRQTAVEMSEADERDFLAFLRSGADIKVIQQRAASLEGLFLDEFPPPGPHMFTFILWNTTFPFAPKAGKLPDGCYLVNQSGAPVIEYSRTTGLGRSTFHGRIYWNTDFASYDGPAYDREAFAQWYDKTVKWIRKHGTRTEITKGWYKYWLPGAWRALQYGGGPQG